MRRIFITPTIERIASDYSINVFNGARKTPKKNLEKLYDWLQHEPNVHDAQLKYISDLKSDIGPLMKAKPHDMKKYIKRYDKCLRDGGGIEALLNQNFTHGNKTKSFSEWVQDALRYVDYIREHIIPYINVSSTNYKSL